MGTEVFNDPARPSQSSGMRSPVVLDEDDWTEALELIVERDYFPDIPKMQNKLEWLQARLEPRIPVCVAYKLVRCSQQLLAGTFLQQSSSRGGR